MNQRSLSESKPECFSYRSILQILLMSFLVIFTIPEAALCFSVTAQVDRNRISLNDSINLSVVFEDGEGDVDTSPITDFSIVSQSSSSNISIINGKYSKSVTAIYGLIPKREGILKIPQLKVEYKNNVYTTEEITVEVSKQTVTRDDSRDIFLESGISTTSLVTGQQAVYQLRLYSAVRYSNAVLQPPSFSGFTAKEAGDRKNYSERINGRSYSVVEINYVIIPEREGELQIDPAIITCDIASRRNSRDPFDDPFFSNGLFSFGRSETKRFSTDPVSVKVDKLPPYDNASSGTNTLFSGLVGSFSIEASLDNTKLKTGDSATLTIMVSGKGNLMDAQAPSLTLTSEFKVYDDAPEDKISLSPEGYSGKKVFKKAIVPVKPGKYTIPSVELVYFDIADRQYRKISTKPITVDVAPSAGEEISASSDRQSEKGGSGTSSETADSKGAKELKEKKSVEFVGKDILPIKDDISALQAKQMLSLRKFLFLFSLPCILFYLFRFVMTLANREVSVSSMMLQRARKSLRAATAAVEESTHVKPEAGTTGKSDRGSDVNKQEQDLDFFKLLHDALVFAVLSKSGSNTKSITSDDAKALLHESGCPDDSAAEASELLSEVESARYGRCNSDVQYRKLLLERSVKLFKKLGVMVAVIAILTSLGTGNSIAGDSNKDAGSSAIHSTDSGVASPESVSGEKRISSNTLFSDGVKAYNEGNFKDAADYFSAIAERGVINPHLYYNIGNAFMKAGDTGRAILWYERARNLMPMDPDLQFNLNYARGFVVDKSDSSGVDISRLIFFWKDYFPPETVQYSAVALSFLFFFYAGMRLFRQKKIFVSAGVILFIVLLLVGGTALYSYYHQYTNRSAVIISKEVAVRSGLSEDATELFILHSGTKVMVEEERDGYIKIFFPRDKIGWISSRDAEII